MNANGALVKLWEQDRFFKPNEAPPERLVDWSGENGSPPRKTVSFVVTTLVVLRRGENE